MNEEVAEYSANTLRETVDAWEKSSDNLEVVTAKLVSKLSKHQDVAFESGKPTHVLSWAKEFPIHNMIKLRWLRKAQDTASQANELLRFFNVKSPEQWKLTWESLSVSYRRSPLYSADPYATSAWLRRGELEAHQIECASFNQDHFHSILAEIRVLTNSDPHEFVPTMRQLCAEAGVAVVFVHELPRLRTSGVTRWITPTKAMIQLSLFYKNDDQLWFTFFHEAGHILLHGRNAVFLEGKGVQGVEETEADQFAADILIPPRDYHMFYPRRRYFSEADVIEFAEQIGIAPGIVVARLQHDKYLPGTHLNYLKRPLVWLDDQ